MKASVRILLIALILFSGFMATRPIETRAQALKLSPGDYIGRFRYSAYNIMVDDQKRGDISTHIDIVRNTYVEGTLIIHVDKAGKIKSNFEVLPDSVPTYYIYNARITPIACSLTSYLEGETKIKFTPKPGYTFDPKNPALTANINISKINTLHFMQMGTNTDCPHLATRYFLERGVNDQIAAMNKFKEMNFNILRVSKDHFSGDIYLKNYTKTLPTAGGSIIDSEKDNFFIVYKSDLLAPIDDNDDVVPLVPEWRTK